MKLQTVAESAVCETVCLLPTYSAMALDPKFDTATLTLKLTCDMEPSDMGNKIRDTIWVVSHSRRALFRVFDIGFGQIEDILGIILVKEFFKKSN